MKIAKGVVMTDGINRYNEFFPLKTVINAYNNSDPIGLPLSLNHDGTRMYGWSFLSGIYIEPGKAYVTNDSYFPENDEDRKKLQNQLIEFSNRQYIDKNKEKIDRLRSLLGDNLSSDGKVAPVEAVAFHDKGILYRIFPDLEPKEKKDLYDISNLEQIGPGIFRRGEYILFAHTFFRRNCAIVNSLNSEFLSLLQSINDPNLTVKIKLDPDMIGLFGTWNGPSREYQYWWGPKFNDDLTKIEEGVARFKNEAYDNVFTNIDFTEFGWYEQGGNKTLECEEVEDRENIFEDVNYYGCRYVHSFLNNETGLPTHLDGAIRAYTDEQIIERLDSSIDKCSRNTYYTKLWRIDGDMPVDLWKSLITQFYRDNRQVGEYLGGEDERLTEILESKNESKEKDLFKVFIPVDLKKGDGIRCFYQKGAPVDLKEWDVRVKSYEYVSYADAGHQKVMELETITLLKRLKQHGCSVRIPYTAVMQHDDLIFNFPVFLCKNSEIAAEVIETVAEFCAAWIANGDDRLISFSINFNQDDFAVRLSFAGHIQDLYSCFLETGTEELKKGNYIAWLLKFYEINNIYPSANQNIEINTLLTKSFELFIPRVRVPNEYVDYIQCEDGDINAHIVLPTKLAKEIKEKNISIALGYVIEEAKCKKCQQNYRYCDCIKFLDDTSTIFEKVQVAESTWTNRHA